MYRQLYYLRLQKLLEPPKTKKYQWQAYCWCSPNTDARRNATKRIRFLQSKPKSKPNDPFVNKAIAVINENIANYEFGKEEFAAAMNVSSSLLYKRIKALTDQSPSDFIKTVRMNHALKLLQSGQYTVTEVSELSGFSSLSIFSRAFKKHFGKTPTEI